MLVKISKSEAGWISGKFHLSSNSLLNGNFNNLLQANYIEDSRGNVSFRIFNPTKSQKIPPPPSLPLPLLEIALNSTGIWSLLLIKSLNQKSV